MRRRCPTIPIEATDPTAGYRPMLPPERAAQLRRWHDDPPLRWFRPRSMTERAVTDEGFASLRRFLVEVPGRLRPEGAVLLSYGSSGDVAHLDERLAPAGLHGETIAERTAPVRGEQATYFVRHLTVAS